MLKPLFTILALVLGGIFFGCNPKEAEVKSEKVLPEYNFETLDSVKIRDVLAVTFVLQSADDAHLVFKDEGSSKVYIFDKSGNQIYEWDKTGDVPGAFSSTSDNIVQDKEGNLVLLDIQSGLKVFEKDGSILGDFGIYHDQYSLGRMISAFKPYQVIEKDGRQYLLYSLDIIEDPKGEFGAEFFKERKNILLTDLQTGESATFLPFPEGSKFLNGNVYHFADFRPVFTYDEESATLYLAFRNEPILYVYDWEGKDPVLTDQIALDLEGFSKNPGFEKGQIQPGQISDFSINPYPSHIVNVEKYDDVFLISYRPTPSSKSDLQLFQSKNTSKELKKELRWKLWKETKPRTVVLTSSGDIVPLDLPEMDTDSFRVIGKDIWWVKEYKGEEEQEEFVLCRSRVEAS